MLAPYVWYSPNDAPLFVPATPGSVLQKRIQEVANKHMGRLGMKVKVIETAGRKLGSSLVNLDLMVDRLLFVRVRGCGGAQGGLPHPGGGHIHRHLLGVRG